MVTLYPGVQPGQLGDMILFLHHQKTQVWEFQLGSQCGDEGQGVGVRGPCS